jgi:secreted trypsin-like serine protease
MQSPKLNLSHPLVFPCLLTLGFALTARADVVGGELVGPQDPIRRSTAALYEPSPDGRGGALCTASLIGKDVAVTAAHCVTPGSKPVLLFGGDVHSPDTIKRQVTASLVNPAYGTKPGMDQGDIALVKFGGGVPVGYAPVKTMTSDTAIQRGTTATLAGFGISNSKTKEGAGVLRKTDVTVENPRKGKSEMVLDQTHGHGACHGDSGGPAFVKQGGKMVLAGVTNRSYPNRAPDDCGHKVVYTKVSAYQNWIKQGEQQLHASNGDPSAYAKHGAGSPRLMKATPSKGVRKRMTAKTTKRSAASKIARTTPRKAKHIRHS